MGDSFSFFIVKGLLVNLIDYKVNLIEADFVIKVFKKNYIAFEHKKTSLLLGKNVLFLDLNLLV